MSSSRVSSDKSYTDTVFEPVALARSRADIVRSAYVDRKHLVVADDPSLLGYFLRSEQVRAFVAVYFEEQSVPANVQPLLNHALHWRVGRRASLDTYLLSANEVDEASSVVALTHCIVEPTVEAERCYDALLAGNPIGPLGSIGVYGNNEPTRNDDEKRQAKRRGVEVRPVVGRTLDLPDAEQERFDKLQAVLPRSASILYEALCRKHHVSLELLLLAAENSQLDPKTRWQMATTITNSFFFNVRMRGFVRSDFVRACAIPILVRGQRYYYLGPDCVRPSVERVLYAPGYIDGAPVQPNVFEIHDSPMRDDASASKPIVVDSDDDVDDKLSPPMQIEDNDSLPPLATDAPVFMPPAQLHVLQAMPVSARRREHLLDLLRTQLHLDTAQHDIADIQEVETAVKHRLLVLMTLYDLELARADGVDEDQLIERGSISKKDLDVIHYYPRGYRAPLPCRFDGAPGLRSVSSYATYAALGLGILCVVVRQRPVLEHWLLHTESLLLGAKKTTVELKAHLDGIVEFVRNTSEPDEQLEPQLAELVAELRESIENKLPFGWREKLKLVETVSDSAQPIAIPD